MSIIRFGEIQAHEGQAGALLEHLMAHFVPGIESSPGWIAYQILQRQDNPSRIIIIEVWESLEAHQASAQSIPPEVVAKVRELVAGSLSGGYYLPIHENQARAPKA
jgi:quinol monooxygenase YgiN